MSENGYQKVGKSVQKCQNFGVKMPGNWQIEMPVKIVSKMSDQGLITKMGISMKNTKKFFSVILVPILPF